MRIFFSIQKTRNRKFHKSSHNLLETKVGITLCNSAKILTIFVSKAVKYESCEFIHALAVVMFRISLEESIDYSSETIKIVCFCFFFLFRQVHLVFCYIVLGKSLVQILNLELLIEKFAVGFGPYRIFFNQMPKLLILEKRLPFWLF